MYWVTGARRPSGDAIPPERLRRPADDLRPARGAGISWKFYVQNYDPRDHFRTASAGRRPQVVWVPLLGYARVSTTRSCVGHIVDLDEYFDDLATGTLPAVAYIVPAGSSEHPPGSIGRPGSASCGR